MSRNVGGEPVTGDYIRWNHGLTVFLSLGHEREL